jgi:hypothetical protein
VVIVGELNGLDVCRNLALGLVRHCLNISPAHWTWPVIEAQGFHAYCRGFFSVPALAGPTAKARIEIVGVDTEKIDGVPDEETAVLAPDAAYDCLAPIRRPADGCASPSCFSRCARGIWARPCNSEPRPVLRPRQRLD